MAAIEIGRKAPSFSLPLLSGGPFSLAEALQQGPVVLAFFKISCPVCQFAFPYLERIYQAAKGQKVSIIGISQNNASDTAAFAKQYGVTFPIAIDDARKYPVSNAYGLTNVPSVFMVSQDSEVEVSSVGWSRADLEDIARRLAESGQIPRIDVIHAGEDVPAFRGG